MIDFWHIETVLFDVDGTLTDSNGAHAGAWTQAFREHGVAVDEPEVRRLVGMGGDKLGNPTSPLPWALRRGRF